MSDVTEKMFEEQLREQENMAVVELNDQELEEVNGAWGDFCPFNNSTSLAVTSIAFTNNNSGIF